MKRSACRATGGSARLGAGTWRSFGAPSRPQLLDLPLHTLLDPPPLAPVLLLVLLALDRVALQPQAVLVEDLLLGELGLGLASHLGDLLLELTRHLLARPLDPLLLDPLERQLVGRLHSRGLAGLLRFLCHEGEHTIGHVPMWHAKGGGWRGRALCRRPLRERAPFVSRASLLLW